ncbi:MAG: nitrous oxide-stimulated promoter family protein [Peptococcaceae bacterium]|nr:nitrous oxide-stimulated promoter family protein [Peptococcaceae bacterium]
MHDLSSKRAREKEVVCEMIALYCRHQHHPPKDQLCDECAALARYACDRVDHCPFMETKSFCSNCRVHCYKPEMREQIRTVMRYAGPRMLYVHPIDAMRHMITSTIEKRRLSREKSATKR